MITQQTAFVLHTRPYRETSLIVEFFSECQGRIAAVARSARGPKSRFRGVLQPFTPLTISWMGKGDLVTLTQAELSGPNLFLNGTALFSGLYLNELLMKCLHPFDAYPQLFTDYQHALTQLQYQPIEPCLRIFEKRLLRYLGFGLQLNRTAQSLQPIKPEQSYLFNPNQGFTPFNHTLNSQQPVFQGKHLLALYHETLLPENLKSCKKLLQIALRARLGNKPICSRLLFTFKGAPHYEPNLSRR